MSPLLPVALEVGQVHAVERLKVGMCKNGIVHEVFPSQSMQT